MVIRLQETGMFPYFTLGCYVLAEDIVLAKLNGDK